MALTKKYVASLIVGWGCRIFPFTSIWFVDCFTTIAFCGRFYCCKEIEAKSPLSYYSCLYSSRVNSYFRLFVLRAIQLCVN